MTKRRNPNDVISEELQNRLIQIREDDLRNYFEIGDIANSLIRQDAERGLQVYTDDIFYSVGVFVGKSPRTVRYYADVARFFVPEVREAYMELSFGCFVVAQSFGSRWREVLEYALEHILASEDDIRAHFSIRTGTTESEYQTPLYEQGELSRDKMREVSFNNDLDKIAGDTPPDVTVMIIRLSDAIQSVKEVIGRLSSQSHVSAVVMDEINGAIETLRDRVPMLIEAVKQAKITP